MTCTRFLLTFYNNECLQKLSDNRLFFICSIYWEFSSDYLYNLFYIHNKKNQNIHCFYLIDSICFYFKINYLAMCVFYILFVFFWIIFTSSICLISFFTSFYLYVYIYFIFWMRKSSIKEKVDHIIHSIKVVKK